MIQTSGCLRGEDEATGLMLAKVRPEATLSRHLWNPAAHPAHPQHPPWNPHPLPSRPNLKRQDFLVARCRNLYKRKAKECQSPSLREEKNGGPKTQRTRPSKLCESQIFTLYSISEKCSPLKKIPPLKNILPSPIRYSPVENNHP